MPQILRITTYFYIIFSPFSAPPTVIRPPPATATLSEGETLVIECEAIGVPTPIIVWRLNWGHVGEPPRVTTKSEDGQGSITIRNVKKEDEGAYTCEALNNKGSIFAQPDTILIVSRKYIIILPRTHSFHGTTEILQLIFSEISQRPNHLLSVYNVALIFELTRAIH